MTNTECAAGLRKLAEMLENNPLMAQPYEGTATELLFFPDGKERFAATVSAFRRGAKSDDHNSLIFEPEFELRTKVFGFKNKCCESNTTTRWIPQTVIPAVSAEEVVIPEHEETVTEWICEPFLKVG